MKFSNVEKTILIVEILALVAGGGVLAFIPEKPAQLPKITSTAIDRDTSGLRAQGVAMLSAEERANLHDQLLVDLNTATIEELRTVPRFGPSTADAVLKYREAHGPFKSFSDLDAIPRLGPSIIEILPKYCRLSGVDTAAARPSGESGMDLNTATSADLQKIPGVGPSMADKIIAARPFRSVNDLKNVPGIGDAKFTSISSYVRVGNATGAAAPTAPATGSAPARINLNSATKAQLETIPGVGPSMSAKIIAARPFASVDELDKVPGVGAAKIATMRPYVSAP